MNFYSLIVTSIIASLVVASLADEQPETEAKEKQSNVESSARAKFVMPKLYDFATYRQRYNKNYEYPAELAGRTKLYIARVCTIFMSVLMYKHKLSSKYLKIGPFTDWTDEERGIGEMDSPVSSMDSGSDDPVPAAPAEDIDQSRGYHKLSKRSTPGESSSRRSFRGSLLNSLKKCYTCSPSGRRCKSKGDCLEEFPGDDGAVEVSGGDLDLDYRRDGCFSPPGNQGSCHSCYAFSILALVAYHHCVRTGEKLAFSEQFIVDCGKARLSGLDGCAGGTVEPLIKFLLIYGLEMSQDYEYKGVDQECPYDDSVESTKIGVKKIGTSNHKFYARRLELSKDHLKELLQTRGPLLLTLMLKSDFFDYGGGVDELTCDMRRKVVGHSMILVGYGIEDGRDYWLLRSSHGVTFGHEGYYKIERDGDESCIKFAVYFETSLVDNLDYIGGPILEEFRGRTQRQS